jgi:hypothetical protein
VLVEEPYDQSGAVIHGLAEPELTHAMTWAASTAAQFDELIGELRAVGTLDAEAEARIWVAGDGAYQRRLWTRAK